MQNWHPRVVKLFIILAGFFVANAIVAELIGIKIFALEDSLGLQPFNWNLFGQSGSLNFTVGVLVWPVVFVMTDIMNEYFGKRGVQFLSWMTVGLISYVFIIIFLAISLAPASWWPSSYTEHGVPNMQTAFAAVFGQGMWIIVASMVAFLIGQILDAITFQKIKNITGERKLWLRATGSTLISQLVDSFVVLYIAFVLGPPKWSIALFLAVGVVNYLYKVLAAIVLTPVIYLAHFVIDRFLGEELANKIKKRAQEKSIFFHETESN